MYDYPEYTGHCTICDKRIGHPRSWIRHLKSKLHKQKEEVQKKDVTLCNTDVTQNVTLCNTNVTQNVTQEPKYKCRFCQKGFNKHPSYYRHMKHYCKLKDIGMNHTTNNTTNNNTTNSHNTTTNNTQNIDNSKNITNNVNINLYGKEDVLKIMDNNIDMYNQILYDLEVKDMIKLYLKEVFINEPSNRNVLYRNLRGNDCMVKVGEDKWEAVDIRDVVKDHIKSCADNIEHMIESVILEKVSLKKYRELPVSRAVEEKKNETEKITDYICNNPIHNNETINKHKRDLYNIRDSVNYK
jgi:hypothetical protein